MAYPKIYIKVNGILRAETTTSRDCADAVAKYIEENPHRKNANVKAKFAKEAA